MLDSNGSQGARTRPASVHPPHYDACCAHGVLLQARFLMSALDADGDGLLAPSEARARGSKLEGGQAECKWGGEWWPG